MSSVSGDYEEDWEAAEPSVGKQSLLSTTGGQIYPLESDDYNVTRDAEPTRHEEHDFPAANKAGNETFDGDFKDVDLKAKVGEFTGADTYVVSEEVPTSEGTLSSVEDEKVNATDTARPLPDSPGLTEAHHPPDLVRIHGQHYHTPPPIPVKVLVTSKDTHEGKSLPKPDIGALQARVAAKRIAEFRRRQASKEEEERALESAWTQKRREIRRSNDAMHKTLGVAGLSAQDHLRIAQYRRKKEAKQREIAASIERQHRWYNCIPKRPVSAQEHVRELQLRQSRAKREWEHTTQLKQKSIRTNQLRLRQKAQAIISKANGAYVPGSYLLKVTHNTIKKQNESPPNDHKEIDAE